MAPFTLIATAAFGLEAVVAREVELLGYGKPTVSQGRVTFQADAAAVCRTNLWLRAADRVQLKLAEFPATTFDELYDQVRALPWAEWLPRDAEFPVTGKSVKSVLHSVPSCQSIIKKATVDALGASYGLKQLPETGPRFNIQFDLRQDVCTVLLDTTGPGLHKRGYRTLVGDAPLKETLAAAIIQLSRWHPDRLLIDPFCGSGTIPIEAALLALNRAPGRNRAFASGRWPIVPDALWKAALVEADDLAKDIPLRIHGSDINGEVLKLARQHADQAGLTGRIFFETKPLSEVRTKIKYGVIITNPPYGERLGDLQEALSLYKTLGRKYTELEGWGCYVLTADEDFETHFSWKATKKRKLYNGQLRCDLYQYFQAPLPKMRAAEAAEAAESAGA